MNHKNVSVYAAAVLCAIISDSAIAAEYTLKAAPQSLADWKNGAFYVGGVAPTDENASSATNILPANMTAKVDDDSIAFVSSLARIIPQHSTSSILEINISTNAMFGCAFYYAKKSASSDTATRGKIVKKGVGVLSLASADGGGSSYFTDFDIQTGALDFASGISVTELPVGRVNIESEGTLILLANGSSRCVSRMISLSGSGTVTNGIGTAANCHLAIGYGEGTPVEFSGRIRDKIKLSFYGYGLFTGENSDFSGDVLVHNNVERTDRGVLGIKKFGMKGGESSIGKGSTITLEAYGGRILYLGNGETTDKGVSVHEMHNENTSGNLRPGFIDGGVFGGLVIGGTFVPYGVSYTQRLVLTGSNTTACVCGGAMLKNGNSYIYLTKRGSGTWRLGSESSDGIDGISVEEGTLQFMKLADVGKKSSFGDGSRFSVDKYVKTGDPIETVPYLFKLGSATLGTLEFVGTNDSYSTSTPLVLAGDGAIINSGTTNLLFHGGISSIVAAPVTLTLGGDSGFDAAVSSVSNGEGVVSIAKKGSGTWILDGTNNTFTGGIDVKAGKLVLRGLGGFTWYRWTIRGNRQDTGNTFNRVSEFAFFDKDNLRTGLNLAMAGASVISANYNPSVYRENVFPGSVALGRRQSYVNNGNTYANMFDGIRETYVWVDLKIGGWTTTMIPTPNDPSTWLTFVMRLADGAAEPKSYDWGCYGVGENGKPKNWLLEGSYDGVLWYTVDDVTDGPGTTNGKYSFQWAFNGSGDGLAMGTADAPHTNGRRFTVLEAASPVAYGQTVSVATGAVLEGSGDIVLSSLKVDPTSGGTIRNVSFAETGVLNLASDFTGGDLVLPLTFENVSGLGNLARWNLLVDGNAKSRYAVTVKDGRITVSKPGFIVLFR